MVPIYQHFLLQKGYKVIGTTRDKSVKNLYRLKKLKIKKSLYFKRVATN
jgi:GDP-D-mannose dehydratase